MKTYLFSILILLPGFLPGQTFAIKDTTWQTTNAGKFYTVREVVYNTGESSLTKSLIGDTATIFQTYYNRFITESNGLAAVAREVVRHRKAITRMNQENNLALSVTGRDALDTITAKLAGPLLAAGWRAKDTAGVKDLTFSVNANGQLRYTVQGFATRNATLFGKVMRLNNYRSSGFDVDVYESASGNWFSVDGDNELLRPGGAPDANKSRSTEASQQPVNETVKPSKKPAKKKKN